MNRKNMLSRDFEIMQMILAGTKRNEIAVRFDICESRVSQIVSKNWPKMSIKDKSRFKSVTLNRMRTKAHMKSKESLANWWNGRYAKIEG